MKLFFSEFQPDYTKYHFPYQVYGIVEPEDKTSDIYEKGFLPTRINKDLFYLARSIRIDLSNFEMNSENRRILRKTDYLKYKVVPLAQYEYNIEIGKMAKEFSKQRFNDVILTPSSVRKLFTQSSMTHVIEYYSTDRSTPVGYCLSLYSDGIFHYSYPFYDLKYFSKNLGMGMILKAISFAIENKLDHFYLGTCYTESSLYKLQFNNIEYFNGFSWSKDLDQLKYLVKNPQEQHLFKSVKDKDSFINAIKNV